MLDELNVPYECSVEHLQIFVNCFEINLDMCHRFGVDEIESEPDVFLIDLFGMPMQATIDKYVNRK